MSKEVKYNSSTISSLVKQIRNLHLSELPCTSKGHAPLLLNLSTISARFKNSDSQPHEEQNLISSEQAANKTLPDWFLPHLSATDLRYKAYKLFKA